MITVFGTAKYLLKCEATFCEPNEHWWGILDAEGGSIARVIMTSDQVRQCVDKQGYEIISAARYFQLIGKKVAS